MCHTLAVSWDCPYFSVIYKTTSSVSVTPGSNNWTISKTCTDPEHYGTLRRLKPAHLAVNLQGWGLATSHLFRLGDPNDLPQLFLLGCGHLGGRRPSCPRSVVVVVGLLGGGGSQQVLPAAAAVATLLLPVPGVDSGRKGLLREVGRRRQSLRLHLLACGLIKKVDKYLFSWPKK